MSVTMTPRGLQLLRSLQRTLELVREHGEKVSQAEADTILAALIAHVRSAAPTALTGGVL